MILNRLIGSLFLTYVALSSVVFFLCALVIWAVTRPFDRNLFHLNRFTAWWALLYVKSMPAWRLNTAGFDMIDHQQPYIIVSNHQSMLDILAGFALPIPFKWVAKAELFRIPLMGWNMALNGYIRIFRGEMRGTREMLRRCEKTLQQGNSVFIFPEGSRSPDGVLRHFKPGAFALASKLGLPVLPVVIAGTAAALPKHSLSFHGRQQITVRVLPPMQALTDQGETPASFAERVQQAIAAGLAANM